MPVGSALLGAGWVIASDCVIGRVHLKAYNMPEPAELKSIESISFAVGQICCKPLDRYKAQGNASKATKGSI